MLWTNVCADSCDNIAIPGLIIALLGLYEVMLSVQVEIGTGIKGLLLSLLPSFPLSALGWYLKRRSQKKAKKSDGSETQRWMWTSIS